MQPPSEFPEPESQEEPTAHRASWEASPLILDSLNAQVEMSREYYSELQWSRPTVYNKHGIPKDLPPARDIMRYVCLKRWWVSVMILYTFLWVSITEWFYVYTAIKNYSAKNGNERPRTPNFDVFHAIMPNEQADFVEWFNMIFALHMIGTGIIMAWKTYFHDKYHFSGINMFLRLICLCSILLALRSVYTCVTILMPSNPANQHYFDYPPPDLSFKSAITIIISFFAGHEYIHLCSTLVVYFYCYRHKKSTFWRIILWTFCANTFVFFLLVLLCRRHYTVEVISALFYSPLVAISLDSTDTPFNDLDFKEFLEWLRPTVKQNVSERREGALDNIIRKRKVERRLKDLGYGIVELKNSRCDG